ncbi:MAG: hypothetical protein E7568_04055 [Ruminococcaceae bacterium]|nr:hypothetical protein [Oscillospiraceae bacterium]
MKLLDTTELLSDIKLSDVAGSSENYGRNLLYYLYFMDDMERFYKEKNIPEEILIDTAKDIVRWSETHYEVHSKLGLSETVWLSNHLNGKIFKLGRLQFDFGEFKNGYNEYNIAKGEKRIGVHIPSDGPLKEELCIVSFNYAREFFAKYFPEYEYKYFTCYSWLNDDTLDKYSSETSNITKFRRLFTVIDGFESDDIIKYTFRWDKTRENTKEFEPTSRFAKAIKEAVLGGEKFYVRLGIIEK